MGRRRLYLACALMALASCADPAAPGPQGPHLARLELTVPMVIEAPLGMVATATVVALDSEGQPVDVPADTRLEVVGSVPYFDGATVAEGVGAGSALGLRSVSPGAVTVRAAAGTVHSPSVSVSVAPAHPVVGRLSPLHVRPGDEAILGGYRLDLLDASVLRAGGAPLQVLARDQSAIRFTVPDLGVPDLGCDPGSWVPIDLAGIPVYGAPPMLRFGVGDLVQLEPGDYRLLGDHDAGCLSFQEATGADYSLLYVDVRPIREAETVPEGTTQDWFFGLLGLHVADRTVSSTAGAPGTPARSIAAASGIRAQEEEHVVRRAAPVAGVSVPTDYLGFIDRPLVPGEVVSVDADGTGAYEAARVLKLYGTSGEVALLGLESEGATAAATGRSFGLDGPLALIASHGLGVMRSLSPAFPGNYTTGQVIMLVRAYRGGFPGVAIATGGTTPSHRPGGYVLWQPYSSVDWASGGPADNPYGVLHEAAHLAQIARDYDACVADADACGGVWGGTWAIEGGADFLAHEALRRAGGYGFTANTPAVLVMQSSGGTSYGFAEGTPTYSFGHGYGYAEWFMRDLTQRLVRTGMAVDEAVRLVALAAYEPWYGWISRQYWDPVDRQVEWTTPSQPVPGLVPRIRDVLGPQWDPAEAILLAAATQAVDDRNPNALLQDLTVGEAHSLYSGAFASIRLGSGAAADVVTRPWTWGWADIEVPAGGGDLTFGTAAAGVEWILVRTR